MTSWLDIFVMEFILLTVLDTYIIQDSVKILIANFGLSQDQS